MIKPQEEIALPAQQNSPQYSALDQSLLSELGSVAMESDIQTWSPNDQLDSRAMVAGFGTKAFLEAAEAAKLAARERLAKGEKPIVKPLSHTEADVLRTGEPAQSALDSELGIALGEGNAATSAQMPVGETATGEKATTEAQPVEPPTATPESEANTAADIANLNPFAKGVSDPASLGSPTTSTDDLLAAMDNPVSTGDSNIAGLRNFSDPTMKQLLDYVAKSEGGFSDMPQKRVQTHEETLQLSQERSTLESILRKPVSEKWSAKELVGLASIMETQKTEMIGLSKQIQDIRKDGGEPDGKLLAEFSFRRQLLTSAGKTLSGEASEIARSLNALQAISKINTSKDFYRMVSDMVENGGGRDSIIENTALFADGKVKDLADALRVSKESVWDKTISAAFRLRYNLMLSSIRTHLSNLVSAQVIGTMETLAINPVASVYNYAEYIAREVIPFLPKMKPEERVLYLQELPVEASGIIAGAKEGFALAKNIVTGKEIPTDGKFMNEMGNRYDPMASQGGILKRATSMPMLMLEAEDAFNKTVFYRQKLNQLALRQARATPENEKAFGELLDNPPDWMHDEAMDYAKRLTLTNDPNYYGKLLGSVAHSIGRATTDIPAFKVIVPFVNTPANAMGYAFNTVGFGAALDPTGTYKTFTEGTPAARAELLSRMTIAAGLWATVYEYWQDGKITGAGSANPDVRRAYEATGWQENSVLVDGKYYSLSRLDPLGMSLAVVAGGLDAFHNQTTQDKFGTFMATMLSVIQISKDRSYLSGLSDFFEIMNGESKIKIAESFVSSQVASFLLPNVLRDAREMTDPYRRQMAFDPSVAGAGTVERFNKYLQNATPGLSKNLPPALDANGDYIKNDGTSLWRGLVPIKVSSVKDVDPVAAMYLYHRTAIRSPDFLINVRGTPIQINTLALDGGQGWLYHEYQKMVGHSRHDMMMKFLESPTWKKLADDGDYGQGSTTELVINKILAEGLQQGQAQFLDFISGIDEYEPNVEGVPTGKAVKIVTPYNRDDLKTVAQALGRNASEAQKVTAEDLLNTGLYKTRKKKSALNLPPSQQRLLDQATGDITQPKAEITF